MCQGCPVPLSRTPGLWKTLYLVRHGEAVHNVLEKDAKRRGAAEAESLGHLPGSPAHSALVEAARRSVLEDSYLHDASLSSVGKAEALEARRELEALQAAEELRLPAPTAIFSSPLQRTLQTTAILFPDHQGIHIREFLRERRTGLPCDERKPALHISRRPSFMHMSSNELCALDSSCGEDPELEDKAKLRQRTARLAGYLLDLDDECVCLVTHKGFLRELERGPLGRPEAPEFANCEVRIYDVLLTEDGLVAASVLRHGGRWPLQALDNCGVSALRVLDDKLTMLAAATA